MLLELRYRCCVGVYTHTHTHRCPPPSAEQEMNGGKQPGGED